MAFGKRIENETRILKLKKRIHKTHKYKYAIDFVKDASEEILNGDVVYAILSGRFIYGDVFEGFIVRNKLHVKHMTISTLTINQENIDSLAHLLEWGYIDKLDLLVSDYFYSHNKMHIKYIYDKLDQDNKFQFSVAGSHLKCTLLELDDGRKITFHGSANFQSSDSIEQLCCEMGEELYNFNFDYHNAIIEKYKTINKDTNIYKKNAVRSKNIEEVSEWQQVKPKVMELKNRKT